MLASEEEEKAKHKVQGGGERRKGAQCARHAQPQQEGDTEMEPEETHIHVECKHGFALISGTRDDTLQPACYEKKCKEDGERWLKSEGLVAQSNAGAEGRAASESSILGMPQIGQNKGGAEKKLQAATTVKPAREKNEAAKGRAIFENFILGEPEIEQDLSCADRSGKTNAHAKGRAIPGTSILGVQGTPEISQGENSILGVLEI